jgi:hypothetical protein
MEVLENEMTKQFDAKLKILMEEEYHNKEKIKALQETIVKQKNDIAKLHHMDRLYVTNCHLLPLIRRPHDRKTNQKCNGLHCI